MLIRSMTQSEICDVYRKHMRIDFPSSELKPLSGILQMVEEGVGLCLGYYEEKELLGYAVFMKPDISAGKEDYILLDYYAIVETYRDKGIGSAFLKKVLEFTQEYGGVMIEVENPEKGKDEEEKALRNRRISFYERIGFRRVPNISCLVFSVDFYLMINTEKEITAERMVEAMKRVYKRILSPQVYKDNIKIEWEEPYV